MKFWEWRLTYGQYVWFHEDGNARVILPLDYGWPAVYKEITQEADLYFSDWDLPENVVEFTNRFLSYVPTAWFRYKTMFELFSGTLDGNTIDPQMFEAGYTRTTQSQRDFEEEHADSGQSSGQSQASSTQDAYTDTNDTTDNSEQRTLNYAQGVQGLNNINNQNIGALGNKYASTIVDSVGNNLQSGTNDYGERNISANGTDSNTNNTSGDSSSKDIFNETVHETRINYYDNLAFLRERADRFKLLTPFYKEFEQFFLTVKFFSGDW